MNTTPTTPEAPHPSYTVVGGGRSERILDAPLACSLLLLNRGGRFSRADSLRDVQRLDADEVISVERVDPGLDLEGLTRQYPWVKFLLLHSPISVGEVINLGIGECRSRLVLVLWSDMKLAAVSAPEGEAEEGTAGGSHAGARSLRRLLEAIGEQPSLCTVPELRGAGGQIIPSLSAPAMEGRRFRVLPAEARGDPSRTFYPFDYCGLYSRERFVATGGYDARIESPYWQKLDFGMRAHLWGERILAHGQFLVSYRGGFRSEDTTPDRSYKRFWLKNVAVRLGGDAAYLPVTRIIAYVIRSDSGLLASIREFREARRWAHMHRYRFKQDIRSLVDQWDANG